MRKITRFVAGAAVLVGMQTALLTAPLSAHPGVWPSENGLIVFRSDRTGEPDVMAMDPAGSNLTNLTQGPGASDLQPAWSPDGGRIAFVHRVHGRPNLFVMTAAGLGRSRLT
jgi:Tol biopolymer transport system component